MEKIEEIRNYLGQRKPTFSFSDSTFAKLGLLISLAFMALQLIRMSRPIYFIPGLFAFLACVSWLYLRNRDVESIPDLKSNKCPLAMASIFFLLLTGSLIVYQSRGEEYVRPIYFFLLLAMMGLSILVESLYASRKFVPLILIQIIIVSLLITFSQVFLYPGVVGGDTWWHQFFTNMILSEGNIPRGFSYSNMPLFHLYIGTFEMISGMDFKFASVLSFSLTQLTLQALLIFIIARDVFHSYRIGLLAALMASFAIYGIGMSVAPNPTALAFTLVLLIILLSIRKQSAVTLGVITLCSITVVLTHTITSLALIIALVMGLIASRFPIRDLARTRDFVSPTFIFFFLVVMFAWWSFISGHLNELANMYLLGFSREYFLEQGALEQLTIPMFEEIFNLLSMFIFYAMALIGILYSLSRRGSRNATIVGFIGLTYLVIGLVSLITSRNLVEQRWWYYALIILTVPLGASIHLIWQSMYGNGRSQAGRWLSVSLLTAIIATIMLISLFSPVGNMDNPVFSPNTNANIAYTASEISGASYFTNHAQDYISSDFAFSTSSSSSLFLTFFPYTGKGLMTFDAEISKRTFPSNGTTYIIRDKILDSAFYTVSGIYRLDYDLERTLLYSDNSKIYTNGGLSGYY